MSEGPVSPHAGTHVPVLVEEVIHALAPVEGAVMVDGTYGGGGYARAALAVANFQLSGCCPLYQSEAAPT